MKQAYIDQLTKINNEKYLKESYQSFISNYPSSRIIMIDLKRFKFINDSYGHDVGDQCLICFANIIKNVFRGDITCRIHGDEYVILTKLDETKIAKKFELVKKRLNDFYQSELIPILFSFNAGDSKCSLNLCESLKMADVMMYHAKKNNEYYQPFNHELWQEKLEEDKFLHDFEMSILADNLSYGIRNIYSINKNKTDLIQLYTRDMYGKRILSNGNMDKVKESILSVELDKHNLSLYKDILSKQGDNYILMVNNRTLFQTDKMVKFLNTLSEEELSKLIVAVDLRGLDRKEREDLIHIINYLKTFNVQILLDKCSSENIDYVWENTEPDYIRFDYEYWKKGLLIPKTQKIIESKISLYSSELSNCKTIFDHIETPEELSFISSIGNDDTYICGDYVSKEQSITLKK